MWRRGRGPEEGVVGRGSRGVVPSRSCAGLVPAFDVRADDWVAQLVEEIAGMHVQENVLSQLCDAQDLLCGGHGLTLWLGAQYERSVGAVLTALPSGSDLDEHLLGKGVEVVSRCHGRGLRLGESEAHGDSAFSCSLLLEKEGRVSVGIVEVLSVRRCA